MMTNGYMHNYFRLHPDEKAPQPCEEYDFGQPQRFTPQFYELWLVREKMRVAWQGVQTLGQRIRGSRGRSPG